MCWRVIGTVVFLILCFGVGIEWGQAGELEEAERLNQQSIRLHQQGNYAQAVLLGKQALAIREKVLGLDHPDTATSLNNLAEVYSSMGEYAKALPLHQRALAIREKVLGPDH